MDDPAFRLLLSLSGNSLLEYELSRRNHAANLRKQMLALLVEWAETEAQALQARWMIDHGQELIDLVRMDAVQERLNFVSGTLVDGLAIASPPKRVQRDGVAEEGRERAVGQIARNAESTKTRR